MAIGSNPVWPFAPNWSADVTETLQWLTDVLASPTGAEQRRTMRVFPRRQFEFTTAAYASERSFLHQFLTTHGARELYLPIWHEAHALDAKAISGTKSIPCITVALGEFREGDVVIIMGESAFDYELAEIQSISSSGITAVSNLTKTWPMDSMLYPVRKARLTDQPQLNVLTDALVTTQVRFQVTEQNNDALVSLDDLTPSVLDEYLNYPVISQWPETRETLNFTYARLLENADNDTGKTLQNDTAGIAFTSQSYGFTTSGRVENRALRVLLYALKGRASAFWLPTFSQDFALVENTPAGESYIVVANVGYTALGGPRTGCEDVMIEMVDGTKLYRHITASTLSGTQEIIAFDQEINNGLILSDVQRISFLRMSRLDQDAVDLAHKTDSAGISVCSVTFRSAPNLRVVTNGF